MPTTYYAGPSTGVIAVTAGADKNYRLALGAIIVLIVVLSVVIVYHFATTKRFAAGLAKCGWTAYFMKGCGWCDKQLLLLSDFDQYVVYAPGGAIVKSYTPQPPLAYSAITGGFPFWYNVVTKETRTGFQDAAALATMSKC
jgi:hypothetical protein